MGQRDRRSALTRAWTSAAFLSAVSLACPTWSQAEKGSAQSPVAHTINIGDQKVRLTVETFGAGGLRFLNLHENESTSVLAARDVLKSLPGTLITVHNKGTRLISFTLDGQTFTFDPNRIFTDAGIERSLRKYGPYSPSAHHQIAILRGAILEMLEDQASPLVIALHNNTPGDYSILEYLPSGSEAQSAKEVFVNPALSPDDFFLVTAPALFAKLRSAKFNVVLQSETPVDDGSLSVWFQQQHRPYANVEALPTHQAVQRSMLGAIAAP